MSAFGHKADLGRYSPASFRNKEPLTRDPPWVTPRMVISNYLLGNVPIGTQFPSGSRLVATDLRVKPRMPAFGCKADITNLSADVR